MVNEQHSRTALLLGEPAIDRLATARVAVFGVGGVGGYVAEALARAREIATEQDMIFIGGSNFVVAEIV